MSDLIGEAVRTSLQRRGVTGPGKEFDRFMKALRAAMQHDRKVKREHEHDGTEEPEPAASRPPRRQQGAPAAPIAPAPSPIAPVPFSDDERHASKAEYERQRLANMSPERRAAERERRREVMRRWRQRSRGSDARRAGDPTMSA